MNLNLTFTAPVRFSIPERFALQKKKKKAHHLLSRTVPPHSSCTKVSRWRGFSSRSAEAWGWAASGSRTSTLRL